MTAVSAAKMIDYPVGQLRLPHHTGLRIPLLLCLGIGLAICAAAAPVAARRLRRRPTASTVAGQRFDGNTGNSELTRSGFQGH
jgi:hypothetical protein